MLVDELEGQGLVAGAASDGPAGQARLGHSEGKRLAKRANAILDTPPAALSALGAEDLEALRRVLASATA